MLRHGKALFQACNTIEMVNAGDPMNKSIKILGRPKVAFLHLEEDNLVVI